MKQDRTGRFNQFDNETIIEELFPTLDEPMDLEKFQIIFLRVKRSGHSEDEINNHVYLLK